MLIHSDTDTRLRGPQLVRRNNAARMLSFVLPALLTLLVSACATSQQQLDSSCVRYVYAPGIEPGQAGRMIPVHTACLAAAGPDIQAG